MNPDEIASRLGQERKRVVRALEVLEERGSIALVLADVRHRFTRLKPELAVEELTRELVRRFHRREHQEVLRIQAVLRLVRQSSCQWNALAAYFGEERTGPCGHCSFCLTQTPQVLPPAPDQAPLPGGVDLEELKTIRSANTEALSDPRQVARFLCGLSSPATTKARLSRHSLFGSLSERRFSDVIAWLESGT
jgi:ATP-dependent DNA helicase RecQ